MLKNSLVTGGLVWAGALAVLAPVTARNVVRGGEFVLITAHGGINFYIGNNPGADGWYKTPSRFEGSQEGLIRSGRALAEEDTGRPMSDSETSRYWFARGLDFIRSHPASAAGLFLRKLYLFWQGYEKPLEGNIYFLERFSPLLRDFTLGFGAVAPFALLGLLLELKRIRSGTGLLTLFVVVYMGTLVLFFVTSRYRLVAVPFFVLFAARGAWWCLERFRGREWRPLAGAALIVAAGVFFSNAPLFGLEKCRDRDLAWSFYDAGNVRMKRGGAAETAGREAAAALRSAEAARKRAAAAASYEAAAASYEEAIRLNPDVPYFYGNYGIVLNRLGRCKEAACVFETFARRWPESPQAHYNLALTYHRLGRLEEAEKEYRAALRLRPNHRDTLENLARICESTGRAGEAAALRRRAAALGKGRR